jgi:hypothetical protein
MMCQRNRIVVAALALTAALCLAAPSPSRAAGPWPGKTPAVDVWERVWSWLAGLVPGGAEKPAGAQRKEGSAINPNGGTGPWITAPVPPGDQADEGGAINPNGGK